MEITTLVLLIVTPCTPSTAPRSMPRRAKTLRSIVSPERKLGQNGMPASFGKTLGGFKKMIRVFVRVSEA